MFFKLCYSFWSLFVTSRSVRKQLLKITLCHTFLRIIICSNQKMNGVLCVMFPHFKFFKEIELNALTVSKSLLCPPYYCVTLFVTKLVQHYRDFADILFFFQQSTTKRLVFYNHNVLWVDYKSLDTCCCVFLRKTQLPWLNENSFHVTQNTTKTVIRKIQIFGNCKKKNQ